MLMSFLAKLPMLLPLLASRYPSFTSLPSSSDWSERPVGSYAMQRLFPGSQCGSSSV